jgi:hypothetical protein
MRTRSRTQRDVLRDKSGLSTNIVEALGGISLKMILMVVIGTIFAGLITFWAVAASSTGASAGFQTSSVGFEKAVTGADIVVGINANKTSLMKNVAGTKCEVSTWQSGTRDGQTTLKVDRKTVAGACATTTPAVAAGAGDLSQELLFGIKAPVFTYQNLAGRPITFTAAGVATLATAAQPADVKKLDWEDARPYKVTLTLENLDKDTAKVTRKATLASFTNLVNVTPSNAGNHFVPPINPDPIPGPLRITNATRSDTTGAEYAGVKEGVAVTFAGAVCPAGPTKIVVGYAQQGPSPKAAVTTVVNEVLTGADKTVHLGMVANGSTGLISVTASCKADGVEEKASSGYTQTVPSTVLTVAQNAAPEKHDLSWVAVSSLPTSFEVFWSNPTGLLADSAGTTTALKMTTAQKVGTTHGVRTNYEVTPTIDGNSAAGAPGNITTSWPASKASIVTTDVDGSTWTTIVCPAGTSGEYLSRFYQQAGDNTAADSKLATDWSATRAYAHSTPANGRTVFKVSARCASPYSQSEANDASDMAYMPSGGAATVVRATALGDIVGGEREAIKVAFTGSACYFSNSKVVLTWYPEAPSNMSRVIKTITGNFDGSEQRTEMDGVYNGMVGKVTSVVTCTAGTTGTKSYSSADYTQPVPTPDVTVAAGDTPQRNDLSWNKVSSLPVTYTVQWASTNGESYGSEYTTALKYTTVQKNGSVYGQTTTFRVWPKVGDVGGKDGQAKDSTSWPAVDRPDVTTKTTGSSWSVVTCPGGTTAEYAGRYYEQSGTSTDVNWRTATSWSAIRSFADQTPGNGRTVFEAQARCTNAYGNSASAVGSDSAYMPSGGTATVGRAQDSGAVVGGVREGIKVNFTGAQCYKSSSKVTITWSPSAPSVAKDVVKQVGGVYDGTTESTEMITVPNGSVGKAKIDVTCANGTNAGSTDFSTGTYTQQLPSVNITVANGETAEKNVVSWRDVSSLPVTFDLSYVSTNKRTGAVSTTALSHTTNQLLGSIYGQTTTFKVVPRMGDVDGPASTKDDSTAWPKAPTAGSLGFTPSNAAWGKFSWSAGGSCPAGTTREARSVLNKIWDPDTTASTGNFLVGAWTADNLGDSVNHKLNQGYPFQFSVDTRCVGDYSTSPSTDAQSANKWNTWEIPKAPVMNAMANWREKAKQPATSSYEICRNHGTITCTKTPYGSSHQMAYVTYCPYGSKMGASEFNSTAWNGNKFSGAINSWDGWETGGIDRWVTYDNAAYRCETPWTDGNGSESPTSYSAPSTKWFVGGVNNWGASMGG